LSGDVRHGKIEITAVGGAALKMTNQKDSSGLAKAARLLDDRTQQMTPVPSVLDQSADTERIEAPAPPRAELDGNVL
jgi:hypothetical protein